MQLLGSQTINGALGIKGTAAAGTGNATAVLLVQSTLPGQRQLAVQQVSSAQTADLFTALDYNGNAIIKVDQNGQIRSYGIGEQILALNTPVITTVTNTGTAGTTTYGYRVAALNSQGSTIASTEVTTTTGNATLDANNYNVVTWNPVIGARLYRVYGRFVGAEALLTSINGDGRTSNYTYNDNTVAGSAVTSGLNPIPNSSLSVNTNTWGVQGGTFVRDQTHSYPSTLSGLSTGLLTSTVASGACTLETSNNSNTSRQLPTVTPGATYSASCYAWLGTMPSITVGINWYDATQTFISQSLGTASTVAGSWNRITAPALVAPAGAVMASVVMVFGETAVGQTAWVTAPQIDVGTSAASYLYDLPQPFAGTKLVVQNWQSATGNVQEWLAYGGGTMAAVGPSGQLFPSVGGMGYNSALNYYGSATPNSPVLRIEGYGNATTGSLVALYNRNITGGPLQVSLGGGPGIFATPAFTSQSASVFQGITGQTAPLTLWRDPTGVQSLLQVDVNGGLATRTDQTQLAPVMAWGGTADPRAKATFYRYLIAGENSDAIGLYSYVYNGLTTSWGTGSVAVAVQGRAQQSAAATVAPTWLRGVTGQADHLGGSATVLAMAGLTAAASISGAVTSLYGVFVDFPTINAGSAISNYYGMRINPPAKSNVSAGYWALYTAGGLTEHVTGDPNTVGVIVRGAASQASNLMEFWANGGASALASIDPAGQASFPKVTGSGGVYDGANRVYSATNPPPGSSGAVSLATMIKFGTR